VIAGQRPDQNAGSSRFPDFLERDIFEKEDIAVHLSEK
jgi:hypothetical protein